MTLTLSKPTVCEPRYETPRSPDRRSFGHQIASVAEKLGQPLLPWQRQVALIGGELDSDTGRPAYREVIITVNRQSGKTTLILSWEIQRAVGWRQLGPQRIVYSAQSGNDARKKLIEDQFPILEPHRHKLGVKDMLRGMGGEAIIFDSGSRIVLLASTVKSGHGKTADLVIKDEYFADTDDRRDQALIPMLMTKPYAQIITASTMGTDEAEPLNNAVERGRNAVELGLRSGTCYFEWSASEDEDPDDPEVWRRCMPALGYTLTEEVVKHARQSMSLPEFKRAFLNIKDGRRADHIIPMDRWNECADTRSGPVGAVALAFDVSPDRSSGAVAIAGDSASGQGTHIEVVEHRPGTGWMVQRIAEIKGRHEVSAVACDPAGPAGGLLAGLEAKHVEVRLVGTREHGQACGGLFDDIVNTRLKHLDQAPLNVAVDGADRRQINDAWLWSRKSSNVDICPLVAVTLARHVHVSREVAKPVTAENLGLW